MVPNANDWTAAYRMHGLLKIAACFPIATSLFPHFEQNLRYISRGVISLSRKVEPEISFRASPRPHVETRKETAISTCTPRSVRACWATTILQ
jgi:hypothetical protein